MEFNTQNNRLMFIVLSFLIFITAFFVYRKTINYELTDLDDTNFIHTCAPHYVRENALIEAFKQNVLFGGPTHYYRPLLSASFVIGYKIAGESESFGHLTNVLLHCICSVLVFLFLRGYIFKNKTFYDATISFAAALLFAVHPLAIYTAAWIPGRNDSIFFINFTAALIFFIEYTEKRKLYFIAPHIFFTVLCFFTKESAVVVPFVFMFYYFTHKKRESKFPIAACVLWLFFMFVFFYARKLALTEAGLSLKMLNFSDDNLGMFFDYYACAFFLRTPFGANVSIKIIIMGTAAIFAAACFAFFNKKDKNQIKRGFFWFCFPFLFLAANIAGERLWFQGNRMYLPMLAIIILFFSFIKTFLRGQKSKILAAVFAAVTIAAAVSITRGKAENFKNSLAFWEAVIGDSLKINITAHKFHSYALINNGNFQEAANEMLAICERTNYSYGEMNYLLSLALLLNGNFDGAAKLLEFMVGQKQMLTPQVYANLIIACYFLNDKEKTDFYFNRLAELTKASPEELNEYINGYFKFLKSKVQMKNAAENHMPA